MPAAKPTALKLAFPAPAFQPLHAAAAAAHQRQHRIAAVDRATGATLATLSVRAVETASGIALVLDDAWRDPKLSRRTALLPRMLAAALLRETGTVGAPAMLAVMGAEPLLFATLARVATVIGAAVALPNDVADLAAIRRVRALGAALVPDGARACLSSGAITHGGLWHGRRLMAADCAPLAEDDLIRSARKMLRLRESKLSRVTRDAPAAPSSRQTPPNCPPNTTRPMSPSRPATPAAR